MFYFRWTNTARLRIGGVEPEVVGQDHATGFKNTQHISTNIAANLWIKNGGNRCVLQNQIECLGCIRQGLSIGISKSRTREFMMRMEQLIEK